ncbi:MAG: SMP-30/gluconolactonase/LRE family protein [Microthrixaceae bacterium]
MAIVAVAASGATVALSVDGSTVDLADPIAASYPEGPLSHGNRLYYAEMGADRVSVVEDGEARTFFTQRGCGPTAIAPYGPEGFLVLCHLGRRLVAISEAGEERQRWEADVDGNALMDPNDASADGRGGVYLSDSGRFSADTEPHGRVLHLTADGELRTVADTLWYPNGVHVDPVREHLYVSEHLAGRVLRFEIGSDGAVGPPATFVRLTDARRSDRYDTPYAGTGPDGLEVGSNGELYVVVYGEGRVLRFARNGAYRGSIELPTRYATNITFLPDGSAVTTGAFSNIGPRARGEVRFHSAESVRTL